MDTFNKYKNALSERSVKTFLKRNQNGCMIKKFTELSSDEDKRSWIEGRHEMLSWQDTLDQYIACCKLIRDLGLNMGYTCFTYSYAHLGMIQKNRNKGTLDLLKKLGSIIPYDKNDTIDLIDELFEGEFDQSFTNTKDLATQVYRYLNPTPFLYP